MDKFFAVLIAFLLLAGLLAVLRAFWVALFGSSQAGFTPETAPDLFIKTGPFPWQYRLRDHRDPPPPPMPPEQ